MKSKSDPTLEDLRRKLHPARFPNMSGRMAAIVGNILGGVWASPAIRRLHVTSDGFVLAENVGEVGANHFIGALSELGSNWTRLLDAARLTEAERNLADRVFEAKFPLRKAAA